MRREGGRGGKGVEGWGKGKGYMGGLRMKVCVYVCG